MATFTKEILSGSTDGKPIKISATASPGTAVHTANATAKDEVWIFATNTDSVSRELTIQFGDTTSPDSEITVGIPSKEGLTIVVPGCILTNSAAVTAFASQADIINVVGYVNRIA